jgi:hypothetical protein
MINNMIHTRIQLATGTLTFNNTITNHTYNSQPTKPLPKQDCLTVRPPCCHVLAFNLFGGRRRHLRTFSQITKLPTIGCGDSFDTIFGPLVVAIK